MQTGKKGCLNRQLNLRENVQAFILTINTITRLSIFSWLLVDKRRQNNCSVTVEPETVRLWNNYPPSMSPRLIPWARLHAPLFFSPVFFFWVTLNYDITIADSLHTIKYQETSTFEFATVYLYPIDSGGKNQTRSKNCSSIIVPYKLTPNNPAVITITTI